MGAEVAGLEANATEQAKLDLANITSLGNLRGTSGWGHGIFGETCCMCSKHVGWNTVIYAAADYQHYFGSHAAVRGQVPPEGWAPVRLLRRAASPADGHSLRPSGGLPDFA